MLWALVAPLAACVNHLGRRPALQDPSDKSFILADDALKGLTGEARFKGFGFAKLIKQHLV